MSKRAVAKWIEINIGDSTNSGSDTILRYALGGIDITHNAQVFKADGNLLGIGNIEQALGFRKTSLVVKLNSTNLINVAHLNAIKYRNKSVKVWIGRRGADGSITGSSVKQIFRGQCDSHSVGRKDLTITAKSFFARFEQPSGTRTSSAAQSYNIKNGLYDVATTTIDKGFDYADRDYSNLLLGKVPARTIEHTQVIVGPRRYFGVFGPKSRTTITTVEHIPGREGEQLTDDGSDYTRPIVFGRGLATGNLIHALNPTQAKIDAVYPALTNASVIENTEEGTKYATLVFAVAEGPVNDISVMFNDVTKGAKITSQALGNGNTGTIEDADGGVIGIIETVLGSDSQTAISNLVSLSPSWTSDHRCIGTALVMVTIAASDNFANGFPTFTFNVGGKRHPQVAVDGNSYSLGANTYGNTDTSANIFERVDTTTAYTIGTPQKANVISSTSPAYAILDLLLNKAYGMGQIITTDDIDLKSFYQANVYERDQNTAQGGRYPTVCRGVLNGGKSFKEHIDSIAAVGKCNLTVIDGKVTLVSNRYLGTDTSTRSSVKTFDEGNIINGIMDIKFAPSNKVYNQITVTVPVTNSLNQETYSLTVEDANALAEDNGQKSEKILTLPMASVQLNGSGVPVNKSKEIVEEIGRFALRRSRLFTRGKFDVDYWDNTDLKPGDVINISSKRYNLTGSSTLLAKVTRIVFKKNGVLTVEWSQFSNLIYDVSQTDITSVSRGAFPDEAFNSTDTFSVIGNTGLAGYSNALVRVFKRASTEPTDKPTEVATYTFDTATTEYPDAATVSNGWHTTVDGATGTGTLFARLATAVSRDATDTIAITEWSGVNEVTSTGIDGEDGINSSSVSYFQRTATALAPSILPQNEATYTFSSGALTPSPNSGWYPLEEVVGTGGFLWFTTATAASRTSTDTIPSSEWAAPILLVENGKDGTDGVFAKRVYKNSADRPTISGGSVNETTRLLTPPAGWSLTPTSGDPQRWFSETAIDFGATLTEEKTTLTFNGLTGGTNIPAVAEITRVGLTGTKAGSDATATGSQEDTDVSWAGTSSNGAWSFVKDETTSTKDIEDAIFTEGKYVLLTNSSVLVSTDGSDWTETATGFTSQEAIAYHDGVWVATGNFSNRRSTDLINWTSHSNGISGFGRCMIYANGRFMTSGTSKVATSTDGQTWTNVGSVASGSVFGLAYGDGIWVAGTSLGGIYSSDDNGATWTSRVTDAGLIRSVTYGNGTFVAATSGSNEVQYSTDGISWTGVSVGNRSMQGVSYDNNKFLLVSTDGVIYTSTNGSSWAFRIDLQQDNSNPSKKSAFGPAGWVMGNTFDNIFTITEGTLDTVSAVFDSSHATDPIAFTVSGSSSNTSASTQFKTALDAAVTAGDLTGVTVSTENSTTTTVVSTTTGERTDLVLTHTTGIGTNNPSLTPTVTVQTQGSTGIAAFKTGYRLTAGPNHSPQTLDSTFSDDLVIASCITQIRNHIVNGDIGQYSAAAVSGTAFDITSTLAGVETDFTFEITQAGTGGDLSASAVVETQGAAATTENTNTLTINIDGVDYLVPMGVGNGDATQALATNSILSAESAVTDDYTLSLNGGVLIIEAKAEEPKDDITVSLDTGKPSQTSTTPTVVIIQGVGNAIVWSTPEKDGVNGDTPIVVGVSVSPDNIISQLSTGFYPSGTLTVKAVFYHGSATPTELDVDTVSVVTNGTLTPTTGDSTNNAVTIDGSDFTYDVTYTTIGDNLKVAVEVKTDNVGIAADSKTITLVKLGPDGAIGPRTVNGTVYYSVAQSSTPSAPAATEYDFDTREFSGLTTNWSKDPSTISASQTNSYFQSEYEIVESVYGGTYTITFTSPTSIVSFTNVLVSGGLTAQQFIKAGDLVTNTDATVQSGSGTLLNGNGDVTFGDTTNNVSWDSSEGTLTVNGTIITSNNILLDGVSLVGDSNGKLRVGTIYSSQIIGADDRNLNVNQFGSNGSSDNLGIGGEGGDGTSFNLTVTGDITVQALNTFGGSGGSGALGGDGGNGGNVSLTSVHGNINVTGTINTSGGDSGSGLTLDGDGGNGGNVTLTANRGCVAGTSGVTTGGGSGANTGSSGSLSISNSVGNVCIGQ